MPTWMIEFAGWFPAILFPLASSLQLTKLLKSRNSEGVNIFTWILMSWANICMYTYTEKFLEWQALGLLLNAAIQVAIVGVILKYRKIERSPLSV